MLQLDSAWRASVRQFLDEELPPEMERSVGYCEDEEFWDFALEFSRKVARRHWIGLTWPVEYGGQARPLLDNLVLSEEFTYRLAPLVNAIGWGLAAGAILAGGSEDQKRSMLPAIADMDTFWAEGLSEPGAGSDLAALTTRAERRGTDWVINGQKTFTTWASHADVLIVAARTDPAAPRHQGISLFCVDLGSPGVSYSALHNYGGGRQNQTYLDDVRVPADMLIGRPGAGWQLIMKAFYGGHVAAHHMEFQRMLDRIIDYCAGCDRDGRPLLQDPLVRHRISEMALIVESLRCLVYENVHNAMSGARPAFAGALTPVVYKEALPEFARLANSIVGPLSPLTADCEGWGVPWGADGAPEAWYRQAFRNHAGGTSQVKRMVLATRGLGLPR
jgi:3-oxocholest-4-en-26-oyl-CoA dehydrogenase alpha subunit